MKRPEPVEIVLIAVPILCEAAAVTLFIFAVALWVVIGSTEVPV